MDAFDADALIYAAVPDHPLGQRVAALFRSVAPGAIAGIGSVLLLPEVLSRPLRDSAAEEVRILAGLLARLDLRPVFFFFFFCAPREPSASSRQPTLPVPARSADQPC